MKARLALIIIGDAVISLVAVYAAYLSRFQEAPGFAELIQADAVRIFSFVIILIASSYLTELYNQEKNNSKREIASRIIIAVVLSYILVAALYFMVPYIRFGRGFLALSLAIFSILQFFWHTLYKVLSNLPGIATRVLIVGTGPLAKQMGGLILATNHYHILSGYINCMNEPVYVAMNDIVNNGEALVETAKRERAQKIVVSLSERRGSIPLRDLLSCKLSGIEVVDAPSFYEQLTGKLLIENITPGWFIFSQGFRMTPLLRVIKRAYDIISAGIGIILFMPFFPVIALIIRLDSPGPLFFKQLRVGEKEKEFMLYKFRTMRDDAERETGAVWAQKEDPRITRVGKFLRKSRIDEIPQLLNVLKGNMSFVGPRPERLEFVTKLKEIIPYYSERHFVKPGVTGWAQVKYPYGASVEDAIEKLRYDLYYIKNLSVPLDLLIIIETIKVVLFGRGR